MSRTPTLSAALLMLVCACTSVKVKRVETGGEQGIRYSLPQPVVLMSPQPDGTIKVSVEYLPDRSAQYAVSSESILATHELSMKLSDGLLTEVNWVADASAVAAQAVQAAGEIQKARIEAHVEAAKAEREADEKQVGDLTADRLEAKIAAAEAKARYAAVKDDPAITPAEKAKALADLRAAEAKVTELERQVADADRQARAPGAGNIPRPRRREPLTDSFKPARAKAWGAVMFRIADSADGYDVHLEPVGVPGAENAQGLYGVYSVGGSGGTSPPSEPSELKVKPSTLGTVIVSTTPDERSLEFDPEIGDLKGYRFIDVKTGLPVNDDARPTADRVDSKHVKVTFSKGRPNPGTFTIELDLATPKDATKLLGTVTVGVRVQ